MSEENEKNPMGDSIEKTKDALAEFGGNVKEKWQNLQLGQKFSNVTSSIADGARNINWNKLNPKDSKVAKKLGEIKKPDLSPIDEFEEKISPYLPTEIAKRYIQKHRKVKINTKKNLVLEWTTVYGWRRDPFREEILKPVQKYYAIESQQRKKINLFLLKRHKFGTILGEKGVGKSSLARWIVEELDGHTERVHISYLDPNIKYKSKEDVVKQIIKPITSLYEKVFKQHHQDLETDKLTTFIKKKMGSKGLVIILDSPEKFPERFQYILKDLYEAENIHVQIIVVGTKEAVKNTLFSGKEYKDELKISIKGVNEHTITQMLTKRIKAVGGHESFPFNSQIIKAIAKKTEGNPLKVLSICREKAMRMSLDERDKIIAKMEEIKQKQEEERQKEKEEKRRRREQQIQDGANTTINKLSQVQDSVSNLMGKPSRQKNLNTDKEIDDIDQMLSAELDAALAKDMANIEEEKESEDNTAMEENDDLIASVVGDLPSEKRKSNKETKTPKKTKKK
jgi:type II secretory pathway predicted ATPase ExeA